MDKHAKTGQELSEEQLHADAQVGVEIVRITKGLLTSTRNELIYSVGMPKQRRGKGIDQKLEDYVALKQFHSDEAKRFGKAGIDTRLGTPGHPPVPGPAL